MELYVFLFLSCLFQISFAGLNFCFPHLCPQLNPSEENYDFKDLNFPSCFVAWRAASEKHLILIYIYIYVFISIYIVSMNE